MNGAAVGFNLGSILSTLFGANGLVRMLPSIGLLTLFLFLGGGFGGVGPPAVCLWRWRVGGGGRMV